MYTKTCLLCGNKFTTNSKVKKYCDSAHYRKCIVCGNDFTVDLHYVKRQTCSQKCARLLRKQNAETTSLEKYGVKIETGIMQKESEYIYPRASVGISPGINLKYFSVECGLGIYFCENLNMTQYLLKTEGHDDIEGTNKVKSYFYIRPTIVGYIPLWDGYNGISVTMGYNFVPQAKVLNGFVFALGIFGEL